MKYALVLLFGIALFASCSSTEESEYDFIGIEVEGEFLFEGPNTLQGSPEYLLDDLAEKAGTSIENIEAVYVSTASVSFAPDSLQNTVESVLVQWVSDDLELTSIATKNPIPEQASIDLDVSKEKDVLPYLKEENSTLVVDANLNQDVDYLSAVINLNLIVEYKN